MARAAHEAPRKGRRLTGWQWVLEHPALLQYDERLTFVRGAGADAVFRACGLDPARAEMRTLEECFGPSGETWDAPASVRVAECGDWVAVTQLGLHQDDRPLQGLPRECDVVVLEYHWMGPNFVHYSQRGRSTFFCMPGESYDTRVGEEPGRFDGALRAAGLLPPPGRADPRSAFVATLAVLAGELGFTLEPAVARGPLPTVFR